jgi:hypothetical protein
MAHSLLDDRGLYERMVGDCPGPRRPRVGSRAQPLVCWRRRPKFSGKGRADTSMQRGRYRSETGTSHEMTIRPNA